MKRILTVFALMISVAALSYGRKVAEGESNTPLGKYKIELKDTPFILAGEELKCYVITYENSPLQVNVYVDKDKKCKNYLVVSDDLSVMYTCNGEYFGVNKLDKKYGKAGLVTKDDDIDRFSFFHQKLLVQGPTGELDATRLIASYYPELLK